MTRLADLHDLLVFDLDGTLVDSHRDIAESVDRALESLSLPPIGPERVRRYVGDGARRLMERALGEPADPRRLEAALEAFLRAYEARATRHTRPYPGVREALAALEGRVKLAVLTNKPLRLARQVLGELDLLDFFSDVIGGDSPVFEDGRPARKPDPAGLLELAAGHGASPWRTLLVGDTAVDVLTARNAGARSAGVTYGFRPEELRRFPPDYVLGSLLELLEPPRSPGEALPGAEPPPSAERGPSIG